MKLWRMGWPDSFFGIVGSEDEAFAEMAELRVRAGMLRRAIIGVNHVASGAAAAAIVAGFVVGAGQRKQRIEQARFLQAEKNGIGAKQGAEAALAELVVGAAGFFFAIGIADFAFFLAAAFEYAQDVAGLRNFPALERSQFRDDAFRTRFLRAWALAPCGSPEAGPSAE